MLAQTIATFNYESASEEWSVQAAVSGNELHISEAQHGSGNYKLVSVLKLEDAIRLAEALHKFIGATVPDTDPHDDVDDWSDYVDALYDYERDRQDAMADAVCANWGHD